MAFQRDLLNSYLLRSYLDFPKGLIENYFGIEQEFIDSYLGMPKTLSSDVPSVGVPKGLIEKLSWHSKRAHYGAILAI